MLIPDAGCMYVVYNLFNPVDKVLAPNPMAPYFPYQIYPSFETDRALGETGYQKLPDTTIMKITGDLKALKSLPENYSETDVQHEILPICDADADNRPDLPFLAGYSAKLGENHGGYMGFRENE